MRADNRVKIERFLQQKVIAVAGFSTSGNQPGNVIYKKLIKNGYKAYAVNPKGGEHDGITIYKNIESLPERVQAIVACTPPEATLDLLRVAAKLDIKHFWVHRSFGPGSSHPDAFRIADENGIELIPAGCPMMFIKPDIIHSFMKSIICFQNKI